jgi:CRISPR/Cas system CSM-associated protein Csm3 (group 7 of RAMP superfamily)
MFDKRIYVEAEIEALSPLHVGTGGIVDRNDLKNEKDERVTIAELQRDGASKPYVPGSTLKGIIREYSRHFMETVILHSIFGHIKTETRNGHPGEGQAGRLIVYGAGLVAAGNAKNWPLGRDGEFVSARTAINNATGAADPGKLFYQEMCAPGARFRFRARLNGADHKAQLYALLAAFAADNGIGGGKGRADGEGRLRLDVKTLSITRETLAPDGSLQHTEVTDFDLVAETKKLAQPETVSLKISCKGPYLSRDWSYEKPTRNEQDKSKYQDPDNIPLARGKYHPELPGPSLMGALRARAEWLDKINNGNDHLALILFGETGQAALLRADRIELDGTPTPFEHTSVKLDRFSGAPIDSALVTTKSFVGTRFDVVLSYRINPCSVDSGSDQGQALAFFKDILLPDIVKNGLILGHGTNMGFGWFKVKNA